MSEPPRIPCPHCGEATAAAARICPRCQRDVRVDVWVEGSPASPRAAYAAAREVEALDAAAGFLAAKRALDAGAGVVLAGVTREVAAAAVELLAGHGIAASVGVHDDGGSVAARPARRPSPRWLAAAAAAGLALAAVVGWLRSEPAPAPAPAAAEPRPAPPAERLSAREIGSLAAASTASVRCGSSLGSGFFVAPDVLVTNAHVLCGESTPLDIVLGDGRTLGGFPERRDEWLDLAVVRVDGAAAQALPLGDASPLQQGDPLFFYGSPRGLDFTLAQAMVSHAMRPIRGIAYLQIDGNVNPGNSGGPLLDDAGRVVGIVTAMVGEASGLGLALPVNYLYAGDDPLVRPPAATDEAQWRDLLAQVGEEDDREVAEAKQLLERPALAGARLTLGGSGILLTAVVARAAEWEPLPETFAFRLERDGELLCTPTGSADAWLRRDLELAGVDEQTRRWLERHQLEAKLWVAAVAIDWAECPLDGGAGRVALVLEQAAAGTDRVDLPLPPGM